MKDQQHHDPQDPQEGWSNVGGGGENTEEGTGMGWDARKILWVVVEILPLIQGMVETD